MIGEDLRYATTGELSRRLQSRELSPVELTRATLERARAANERLNCFIRLTEERAMESARRAEQELLAGEVKGPLHGVPYSLKDLYYTRGIPTSSGAGFLRDFVPDEDSTCGARLDAAGAVLIGKCNTSEFAAGPDNKNVHFGPARNPWDETRIPGGSSGGSGAAVAAGVGAFSMGSDTGGSVRNPAALCGTVGLKPTYGRASKYGVTVLSWSLDTVGPLTRTVEDAALILEVIAGYDPKDQSTSRRPVERYSEALSGDIRGLRVGVPREHYWDPLDPEVGAAARAAIARLGELGAEVVEVSVPWVEHAFAPSNLISWVESSSYHGRWQQHWASDYGPEIQQRSIIGRVAAGPDYVMAQRIRGALIERARELFQQIDLFATPTCPCPAPPIADDTVQIGMVREPVRSAVGRLCRLGSLTGYPAVAVPCGFTADGLPLSLQLMAGAFREATALRAAHAYEQATEWHRRRPPI